MKINPILFFLNLTLWALCAPLSSEGMLATQIYCTDFILTSEPNQILSPGDEIQGSITLWNYEDLIAPDLKLRIELINSGNLIAFQDTYEIFAIPSKQEIIREFNYIIPSYAPSGDSILRVQVINSRGEELSWLDENIKISSQDQIVLLDDFWFVKDEINIHPGSGLSYQPNEESVITFKINNRTDREITVYPTVRVHQHSLGSLFEEKTYSIITLAPSETISQNLSLPAINYPSSYLAELVLYDAKTGYPISNTIFYRWIISGRSARILSIGVDQALYRRNEQANLRIQLVGPADYNVPLQQGTLLVIFYNHKDEIVGQAQKLNISLSSGQEIILSVPIEEEVSNPRIVASIYSGEITLDEYTIVPKNQSSISHNVDEKWWQHYQEELLFIIAMLISLFALAFYCNSMKEKKEDRNKDKITILFFVIFLTLGFNIHPVQAATEVTGGCCDTYMQFVNPLPVSSNKPAYFLDEEIRFTGRLSATQSSSQLFYNKISFYITEDKDIPIIDCCQRTEDQCSVATDCLCSQGCQQAYNSESEFYSLDDIKNAIWCDQVKDIAVKVKNSDSGEVYQIRKLGELLLDDSPQSFKPYAIEYDQVFTIPRDLSFSGPVRFYVVYYGMHGSDHWHWNISYQEGYIAEGPDIKNTWEEWNYTEAPLQPILNWDYYSQNDHPQIAYKIVLSDQSDFSKKIIETDVIASPVNSYGLPSDLLAWNSRYYWKVEVKDNHEQWSAWSNVASFITPKHPYPLTEFDWTPKPVHAQLSIRFVDQSVTYGEAKIASRSWVFQDRATNETIATSRLAEPVIAFSNKGYIAVTLTITDSSGYVAILTKNIEVRYPLDDQTDILPTPF